MKHVLSFLSNQLSCVYFYVIQYTNCQGLQIMNKAEKLQLELRRFAI